MKIIKNNIFINIDNLISIAENNLKSNNIYTLCSNDHLDHIASYIAWKNVGGNIFVKSPFLPTRQIEELSKKIDKLNVSNSIIFHTSGTTGIPKLVIHKEKQINEAIKMSTAGMKWESNTKFLNFMPAFTSGFWHIVLVDSVFHDATLIISSKETMIDDFKKSNSTLIVPSLIDQLRSKKISLDLSRFSNIAVGSSQVLFRHSEYIFNNNANTFTHVYGSTETCSTTLSKESYKLDDTNNFLDLKPLANNEFKLVNNELWIKGPSLCENIQDFNFHDGWFQTGDLWEQTDNMIKFIGRSNDICKINGYQCSLLLVESLSEDKLNLGSCLAVPRHSHGIDWIELFYTNKECKIDKVFFKEILSEILPSYNIPRKYTYVEEIPRNGFNKKVRNVF